MTNHKPCSAQCDSRPLTPDEGVEALDNLLEALRANPEKARELAVLLRLAADQKGV